MLDDTAPPPCIDCARVVEYAVMDESVGYSGRTLLFVDGEEIGQMPCMAICEYSKDQRVMLFHCNREWKALGASAHGSAEEAEKRAECVYPGVSTRWVNAGVSTEQAELYLDEKFGAGRCSFCGTRADLVEQLIQKNSARIYDRYVKEFHKIIFKPGSVVG